MIFNTATEFLAFIKAKSNRFRLMALDLGLKKVGLAFYDSDSQVSVPFKVLPTNELDKLVHILKDNTISGLVVGLPMDKEGNVDKERQKFINQFLQKLEDKINLPVTFADERFTTKQANKMLTDAGMNRKKRNLLDDAVSAQLILDSFLRY